MKLRHAAALALVGWYLMVPPLNADGTPNAHAPLSQWSMDGSYDTAKECTDRFHSDMNVAAGLKRDLGGMNARLSVNDEQCIATDDPRLKGS